MYNIKTCSPLEKKHTELFAIIALSPSFSILRAGVWPLTLRMTSGSRKRDEHEE